jgi:hypothetical protein
MKPKTKALLDKVGATKVKFYEIVEPEVPFIGPILTVCLLLDDNVNVLSRGVSIKSVKDSYDHKNGKDRSFKRALTAAFKKSTALPVLVENHGWKKYCKKIIKIKDVCEAEKQLQTYYELMHSEGYSDIPGYVVKTVSNCKTGKTKYIAIIYIPRAYPLEVAIYEQLEHKSVYKPKITEFEKEFIQKHVIEKENK